VSIRACTGFVTIALCASVAGAQSGAPGTPARLTGRLISSVDSQPVRGASIRLLPVDSTRIDPRMDVESAVVFVDSSHARFVTSDSLGAFVVADLAPRRYAFQIKRIGFTPREGVVTVDMPGEHVQIPLDPTSKVLSGMSITETEIDKNGRYLKSVGYTFREHGSLGGHFITAAEIAKRRWVYTDELLLWENLKYYRGPIDVRIDGIGVPRIDAENFPANLIMAVEVYPRGRPLEFDHAGPPSKQPLVLIWTYR